MTLGIVAPPSMELLSREPTSAMPERDLIRGYSPPMVSSSCACGRGRIEAIDTPKAIAAAVHFHNSSTAHSAWAVENGWRHDGQRIT